MKKLPRSHLRCKKNNPSLLIMWLGPAYIYVATRQSNLCKIEVSVYDTIFLHSILSH